MLPSLLPGHRYSSDLSGLLRRMKTVAETVRGTGGSTTQRVEGYLNFCAEATAQLRHVIRPSGLARLLNAPIYHMVLGLHPGSTAAYQLADLEVSACVDRFDAAAKAVDAEWRKWEGAGYLIVPDTNVFLHALTTPIRETDWRSLAEIGPMIDVTVVLLLAVIDELDRAKRTNHRTQARTILREIDELLGESSSTHLSNAGTGLTWLQVLIDDVEHEPLPRADAEIIDRTLTLVSRTSARVYLLTGDTGMAIRARHAGLLCTKVATPDR